MQIIGHRGASGYKPENTLASFKAAIAQGVDMIELDVYALKTGQVVVIHDATVDRTTNGSGPVNDFSYQDLRQLDAGSGEKIPLLIEVLDLINKRVPINIEIKGGRSIAAHIANIIEHYVRQKGWSSELFLVSSFDHQQLRTFAKLQPNIRLGALFEDIPTRNWVNHHKGNVFSANIDAALITNNSVDDAHTHGLKVYAYTVNNKRQAQRMRMMKVDGIFTNYPDKFAAPTFRS